MTAAIAKARLVAVLADDHGRGTRAITARDVASSAIWRLSGESALAAFERRLFNPAAILRNGVIRVHVPGAPKR